MPWLLRLFVVSAAVYLLLCASLFLVQRRITFPAAPGEDDPFYPPFRLIELDDDEGGPMAAMYAPAPEASARTVVIFHGNADRLSHLGPFAMGLHSKGLGVLAVEYPGYGRLHKGSPSEAALYASAAASLRWLRSQGVAPEATVLLGQSLGAGVAVEMATHGFGSRVVLISPFTSVADMARERFPFVPVSLLIRDHFDNLEKAPRVSQAVLLLHGTEDRIVPFTQGQRLAEALPQVHFEALEGLHHNDLPLADDSTIMNQIASFAKDG